VQEYWFKSEFRKIFENKTSKGGLGNRYDFYGLKRPTFKEDGVGFFVDRVKVKVLSVREVMYGFHGQRCALLIHAAVRLKSNETASIDSKSTNTDGEDSEEEREIIVANTHLTFPHSRSDNHLRLKQAMILIEHIDAYVKECVKRTNYRKCTGKEKASKPSKNEEISHFPAGMHKNLSSQDKSFSSKGEEKQNFPSGMDIFVCGDFNGGIDDVYRLFEKHGYVSSYGKFHSKEAAVTHYTHKGESVGVDFIWYRPASKNNEEDSSKLTCSITVANSTVLPKTDSVEEWPLGFTASDHRPLVSEFTFSSRR